MAQANPGTWELIKQLWIQGLKPDIIAERYGVTKTSIVVRARRNNWIQMRTNVSNVLISQSKPMLAESVASASIAARKKLSEHLVKCVDSVPEPKSFSDAMRQQSKLEPLIRNAEKLFQWSQAGQSSMVSIQSLSQDAQVGQLSDGPAAPMIDVTPVSTERHSGHVTRKVDI